MKIKNDNRTVLCPTHGNFKASEAAGTRYTEAAAVAETNVFTYRQRGVACDGNKTECLIHLQAPKQCLFSIE